MAATGGPGTPGHATGLRPDSPHKFTWTCVYVCTHYNAREELVSGSRKLWTRRRSKGDYASLPVTRFNPTGIKQLTGIRVFTRLSDFSITFAHSCCKTTCREVKMTQRVNTLISGHFEYQEEKLLDLLGLISTSQALDVRTEEKL